MGPMLHPRIIEARKRESENVRKNNVHPIISCFCKMHLFKKTSSEEKILKKFKKAFNTPPHPFLKSNFRHGSYVFLTNNLPFHTTTLQPLISNFLNSHNLPHQHLYIYPNHQHTQLIFFWT